MFDRLVMFPRGTSSLVPAHRPLDTRGTVSLGQRRTEMDVNLGRDEPGLVQEQCYWQIEEKACDIARLQSKKGLLLSFPSKKGQS